MAKKKDSIGDYLAAVKRAAREEEIRLHGKLITTRPTRVAKSKKIYSRKGYNKKNPDYFSPDFFLFL
ncbi:MAG: hypothetical protein J5826_01250 [Bacteroidales bacterium]|nr:hypothetical protein [Bacteroidales bacterium]MBP5367754.1 hypothetical protein [Bacteroidales bacterium]